MRPHGFEWTDRVGCVDTLATQCIESNSNFEEALKVILLQDYCLLPERITKKQLASLKKDVKNKVQDLKQLQNAPGVGDIVLIPKKVPGLLPGVYQVHPRDTVSAEITDVQRSGTWTKYTFKRLQDSGVQDGNGHDIKKVIRKASQPLAFEHG
ncbi:hypothetical protein [Paenibacillus sp. y28]|uniref:hypothetical protein n=1 Tax=Paenibacillus sp. y28 TaxID=3129110 RepID=UPI003019AAB7